jgi:hypothetical protein
LIVRLAANLYLKEKRMLSILERVLNELPDLMAQKESWQSLNVNYETPNVQRIWRQHGDIRINLHRIMPSKEKPFFHPHPWPCSVAILKGAYKMGLGYGNKKPKIISTCVLSQGSKYEMVSKHAWHYIDPINEPVYSIMISGIPWKNPLLKNNSNLALDRLNSDVFNELFDIFIKLILTSAVFNN